MSSFNRDRYRKVSEPTEADFIRGISDSQAAKGGKANFLATLILGLAVNEYLRRRK